MSTTINQSLTFITYIVSEKITTFKCLPHTDKQPADLTLIITQTHIFHTSQKVSKSTDLRGLGSQSTDYQRRGMRLNTC